MGMTRKKGKGYLWSYFGGELGADSLDSAELVNAAERSEGIAVGDDPPAQGRTDPTKGLDLGGCCDVEVDDSRDERC